MSDHGVGRVDKDKAGGIIISGAKTVKTENSRTVIREVSIIGGPPNKGDVIISTPTTVFAENHHVGTVGATTARGFAIGKASTTVFAGNTSGGFIAVPISPPVVVVPELITIASKQVNDYISNPTKYYNSSAAGDGVKKNYRGTIDDVGGAISQLPTTAVASNIVPFLEKILKEAARGQWRETGQGRRTSNSNILEIWRNLGFANVNPWNTDQTAWCMGFVNFVLKAAGYRYVQTASAAAITTNSKLWNAVQIPKDKAQPGDIAFWSYRHVNFVYTANNGRYSFVGGNQSPQASNNPNDGDVTNNWPTGTTASNPNWVSCWRPSRT
jgi:hypothetical protein